VLVSLLFALVPLLEIRAVKPLLLLRSDTADSARVRTWQSWLAGGVTAAALTLVAAWQAQSLLAGLYASAGLLGIAAVLYAASWALVRAARPLARARVFMVRHAAISLARPGNQTRVILMSVGLGCFFIVGVRAVQGNLLDDIATQVGETTPDLVLIDIQKSQVASLETALASYTRAPARITPLLRGRVVAVDGSRLKLPTLEAVRDHGKLSREFGLTFRSRLEANERLVAGTFWPSPAGAGGVAEVSVEERAKNESGLALGDMIRFDIAGRQIDTRVTSVRAVAWEDSQNGGFVFVLRPSPAVEALAHTYVGFVQLDPARAGRGELQRDLVTSHPNVSVIDVRDVVASIREVVGNVTLGITVVGAVMLVGGVLILVGAVAMTKFQRLYEAAIYRTLGASARLVGMMMAVEYAILGTLAGILGSGGGLLLSWALATYLFEIPWQPATGLVLASVALTGAAVTVVGVLASSDVLVTKPLGTLRAER
jgi:putative ABC transport system permease protein